ncbi:S41 family peptidase [Spongiivirga citrea]|uniref:Tail specific protease domain-containing protein n=1 Tax=Spongiivirga citrea TaxID=1481457 RepID=A0A6M0CZ75_9FLAO|nr:S41 family peptidase [Spongiivirga citrea]NER19090.1 hypothetical protein [Spongiivirga citrea]
MSRIIILLSFLFSFNGITSAQSKCECEKELDFVTSYYERNLPGFKDNVTSKNTSDYNQFKKDLATEARKTTYKLDCFKILTQYVEFFKDNHSSIYMRMSYPDEKNTDSVSKFKSSSLFLSRESIALSDQEIKQYPVNDVRGIYQTKDSSYTVMIIPNKTALRDYVAIIIESKSAIWDKGQVKMEIKKKKTGGLEALVYLRNHSIKFYPNFSLISGVLGTSWFKTSLPIYNDETINAPKGFSYKKIQDSISYIRIPTFSSGYSAKIDSLYQEALPNFKSTPYLIIDVRNNGGGSDTNANPLLKYIYSNPFETDKVDLWVTPDNLKIWEKWTVAAKQDPENYSNDDVAWFENEVMQMKKAKPYSWIPRSKGRKVRLNKNKTAPWIKKVVVITNRNCASSCETLLFWAKKSDKSVLVGENSGGYVGYGEVGTVQTPCYNFTLSCTMTRYQEQRKYEVIGISPDIYFDNQKDWITQAIQVLQEK